MSLRQFSQKLVMVAAGLLLALPLHAGDVPSPVIPKAKAKANEEYGCVEPLEVMRKNHMEFILHQRDDTMYNGIRTSKYALAECINCHVAPEQDGSYARYGDEEHFCSTCHTYAAVNIDCFGCHRDTPARPSAAGAVRSLRAPE